MRSETGDLARLRDVSSTLVLGPSVNDDVTEACTHLLGNDGERPLRVFVVGFVGSPASRYRDWIETMGEAPDEFVVVTTDDGFGAVGSRGQTTPEGIETQYVSSPGDLTGIGMILGKYLERWQRTDADVHICFDGLTTVLQYSDAKTVFRFLHLMTTRLDGAGACAHFHLDPATQDDRTVATLQSAFHAVARHEGEGEWVIHRR